MIARYRILYTREPDHRLWQITGAVYERSFGGPEMAAVPVVSSGDVKVNWRDWRDIAAREREHDFFDLRLENYDLVFRDHADRYRLSDKVYTIEGESYKDIRQRLYQRYVLGLDRESAIVTYERTTEPALVATIHEESSEYTSHEEETQ